MDELNNQNMLQVGTILHGTYKIESYLSSGGFGNTYLAKNIEFDETYAIKEFFVKGVCQRDGNSTTISVSNAENTNSFEQQREKFKKEARRLRSLSNPHIVKVYDLFEENGTAYYVMDYVDGENLSARLKRTNAPLAESEVRNYLNQILDGLEAIHNEGMFHLDIKPANIMVDSHDVVKLIDFGASKQQSTVGGATMSTGISYTNGYAPSEQMAQSYDKFGPWTDFYALGATMYKLLTNQDPPSVSDLSEDETEDKHLALPMPDVSGEMKKLVVWMMQVNRLKRPKNVGEIRRILQQSSAATSNNEETKAFSPHHSYANSVDDEEETVWASKHGDAKVEENEQPQSKIEKQTSGDTANKNTHFVVVFILVIVVVCAIAFMTRGCGNVTKTATNAVAASADSDSMWVDSTAADTMQYYGEDYSYGYHEVTYEDGSTYKGEFKNGNPHGKGVMEWPNGKNGYVSKYEGQFANGNFNGIGNAIFFGGSTYNGSWINGVQEGYGQQTFPYDENHPEYIVQYDGNFKNGQRSGKGTAYYGNHTYQTGTWKKDELIEVTEEGTWN